MENAARSISIMGTLGIIGLWSIPPNADRIKMPLLRGIFILF